MSTKSSDTENGRLPFYHLMERPDGAGKYPITSAVDQAKFDSALAYRPVPDDVFVATYPKNGTTWMVHIVNMLLRGVDVSKERGKSLDEYYTFLEFEGGQATQAQESPRIVKTHLPFELTPYRDDVKYIFVARNPKDCAVSFFHHTVGFPQYYRYANGKFDDFCQLFIDGKCEYGDYFHNVPGWYKQSLEKENICMFLYEDMKSDLESELRRLAAFLGAEYTQRLTADDDKLLKEMVESASIGSMKANNKQFMKSERPAHLPFVRKGVVGDWRSLMTSEQSAEIDRRTREAGERCPGFDKLWSRYRQFLL